MNSYLFAAALTACTTIVLAIAGYIYTRPLRDAQTVNYDVDSIAKVNTTLSEEVKRATVSEKELRLALTVQEEKCKREMAVVQGKLDDRQQEVWRLRDRIETLERQLGLNQPSKGLP